MASTSSADEFRLPLPAQHYADTIERPVPVKRMEDFLKAGEIAELKLKFPSGSAATWGVTPGDGSRNEAKWDRMNAGDVAVFSREGHIFSGGLVRMKIHSPRLARELWGEDEDGETWEFMYFLDGMRNLNIPYAKFNAAAEYAENNVIQGFTVLSEEKSIAVLKLLNMNFPETPREEELERIEHAISEKRTFDPESEGEGREKTLAAICIRRGQPKFRRNLINAYKGRCAISGCDAVQTLEAAHILAYNGPKTNHTANGLLLRADLHVLFDLGLIAIDPGTYGVVVASSLKDTTYAELAGCKIRLPGQANLLPSKVALQKHRISAGL